MSDLTARLTLAQAERRARVERSEDERIETLLNVIGLSETEVEKLGVANVSPSDRKKLKGIINRLRKDPHPFRQCMKDLRKHQPGWSEERREKTCAVLKQLTGKKATKASLALSDEGACVVVDEGVATLLEYADLEKLYELIREPEPSTTDEKEEVLSGAGA